MTTINKIVLGDCLSYIPKIRTPINCVITDPPYGMNFQSNQAKLPEGKVFTKKIAADDDLNGALKLFGHVMTALTPKLADECELYVFTAWHVLDSWMPLLRTWERDGVKLKQMLVWDKGDPGMGDLDGNWGCGHEIILYLKKGRRQLPKRRSGIIHVDKVATGTNIHPTEKPVPLLRHLIEMSTSPGDLIVDPFSGSGSTSKAAQDMGRNSLAFEIDEEFWERSNKRLDQVGLGL